MIGFQPELHEYAPCQTEGLETSNLQKNELYDLVSNTFYIPPYGSKGTTREWLLDVYNSKVYRITVMEFKQFDIRLSKEQLRRTGTHSNALLVRKLNLLLSEREEKPLGFTEHEVPDQTWLYRIARYIDQTNLLEFFEAPVKPEPPLTSDCHIIPKIHFGRLHACQWLFRTSAMKTNKKLWEQFKLVSETYRMLSAHKINTEILEYELDLTRKKVISLESTLQDLIHKSAFTYSFLEDPNIRPEVVMAGGDKFTAEMREQLNTNAKLYD